MTFEVWAPRARQVRLSLGDDVLPMMQGEGGWWAPEEDPGPVADGTPYGFLLDEDEKPLPDPRSLRQPDGVHERSATFDLGAFAWTDRTWTGRQLAGATIYELHVGTFTPAGTLDAVAERLDHLASIGVGFIELMPVNAFNGTYNWGYDGVLWSAVHEQYGGPAAYQRLVDACHRAGIGVIQDVVYNHLGPSGNYLPRFGPYLKEGRNTWGDLVNLDGDGSHEVRRLILDNALMWLRDFHVDGLRLDAVHALMDDSEVHLLEELTVEVRDLSVHLNRPLTLIAESDLNDPRMVTPREGGGFGLDAQWSDDFHHAVHVAITGETEGYYADFAPLGALAKVLDRGFFHDGTFSSFRDSDHGRPVETDRMPSWRLVVCAQNHDQVGNRARGDRTAEHLDPGLLLCGALLTLAAPFTPMLFQGEEWAASTPFAFFTSHPEPELAKATAEGRLAEFEQMGWKAEEVLDPQDPQTFEASRLRWDELSDGRHATVLAGYRRLASLRRELHELTDPRFGRATADEDRRRLTLDRGAVAVHVNLGEEDWEVPAIEVLFSTTDTLAEGPTDGTLTVPARSGVLVRSRAADGGRGSLH